MDQDRDLLSGLGLTQSNQHEFISGLVHDAQHACESNNEQLARPILSALSLNLQRVRFRSLPSLLFGLERLSDTLVTLCEYGEARRFFGHALLHVMPDHPHEDTIQWRLQHAMTMQGDYPAAIPLQRLILKRTSLHNEPHSNNALRSQSNLAVSLHNVGELEEALSLLERVHEIRAETLLAGDPELLWAKVNLAATVQAIGNIDRAQSLLSETLRQLDSQAAPPIPLLTAARQGFAICLKDSGDLVAAKDLEWSVLSDLANSLPRTHPHVQVALQNFAGTLRLLGQYELAQTYAEYLLHLRETLLPDGHPHLQLTRHTLADILHDLGDHHGAHVLREKVLIISSRTLKPGHPFLRGARSSLASSLTLLGRWNDALTLFRAVLSEAEKRRDPEDIRLQGLRSHVASCLEQLGEPEVAQQMKRSIVEALENQLPATHPALLGARENLAGSLFKTGALESARSIFESVLAVRRATTPLDKRSVIESELRLLSCLVWTNNSTAAVELALIHIKSLQEVLLDAALSRSPRESEMEFWRCFGSFSPLVATTCMDGTHLRVTHLRAQVFALMESGRSVANLVGASLARCPDTASVRGLRSELRGSAHRIARLAKLGVESEALRDAWTRRDRLQTALLTILRDNGVPPLLDPSALIESLHESLTDHQAFICYWRLNWLDPNDPNSTPVDSMFAWIVTKQSGLSLQNLGPFIFIEQTCSALRASIICDLTASIDGLGNTLRTTVIDPLLPYLGASVNMITIVCDSVLHSVPLDALPFESGVLSDRFDIRFQLSVFESLWPARAIAATEHAVLVGNIDYDWTQSSGATQVVARGTPNQLVDGLRSGFSRLAWTKAEIENIAALWAYSGKESDHLHLLEGGDASFDQLARLAGSATWLHIATHGWYAPESVRALQLDRVDAELGTSSSPSDVHLTGCIPLVLCGLAFRGANCTDSVGLSSGAITAEELCTLDLSACALVVLSACNTNLGIRRVGQGVASLQRAMHLAGARCVVSSLWNVPDKATAHLMEVFYRSLWISGYSIPVALERAKKELRNEGDSNGRPKYSMRDWAGWVLTGR